MSELALVTTSGATMMMMMMMMSWFQEAAELLLDLFLCFDEHDMCFRFYIGLTIIWRVVGVALGVWWAWSSHDDFELLSLQLEAQEHTLVIYTHCIVTLHGSIKTPTWRLNISWMIIFPVGHLCDL